ncbi:MAG: universal stress protein [Ignavibacteriales bacterium]|nr:MAG: universal stress protein [Ignavibacteriales bacterium]
MISTFKKLGLAITFSPTGKALLKETKRLTELFNSKLVLIHVGEKNSETERNLDEIIHNAEITPDRVEVIWTQGEPANAILNSSKKAGVDLLIAGALEKEKLIKYYIGSVARKIMREASSSSLILTEPSLNPQPFKKFYISTDFSPESERTIKITYEFALLEKAEEFVIISDYNTPGLASTILDSASMDEIQNTKKLWQAEEEENLKLFVKELNLKGLETKTVSLYGKEGWEATNYARQNEADIFAVTAPQKRLKFIDRLFHHELEYSFENLPSNLLIIR